MHGRRRIRVFDSAHRAPSYSCWTALACRRHAEPSCMQHRKCGESVDATVLSDRLSALAMYANAQTASGARNMLRRSDRNRMRGPGRAGITEIRGRHVRRLEPQFEWASPRRTADRVRAGLPNVAMEGTYDHQVFHTRWADYTVDRVRSWRNLAWSTSRHPRPGIWRQAFSPTHPVTTRATIPCLRADSPMLRKPLSFIFKPDQASIAAASGRSAINVAWRIRATPPCHGATTHVFRERTSACTAQQSDVVVGISSIRIARCRTLLAVSGRSSSAERSAEGVSSSCT